MNKIEPARSAVYAASVRLRLVRALSCLILPLGLAGCLPGAAPTTTELLTTQKKDPGFDYSLVPVDSRVVSILSKQRLSFGAVFKNRAKYVPRNSLRPGDTVAVTIYETGGSSLFPPPSSNTVQASLSTTGSAGTVPSSGGAANTIPAQVIEADGTIGVPFVGRVKISGMTPSQVGALIERELKQKAVAPQVIVTQPGNVNNTATVNGEVNAPKVIPLSLRGERLMEVIAAAGGPKYPAYETYVHVVRKGSVGTMLLQSVVTQAADNIVIQPSDQIFLTRNPRTFVVMGATLRPAVFPFDRERISLAEAIAQAGGPIDSLGDLGGVYLFRYEPVHVAKEILDGVEIPGAVATADGEFVPVLYKVGLRDAQGYFLAQAVQMRDKDIVLIANAEGAQLLKALAIVRGFTGIAYDLKRQALN